MSCQVKRSGVAILPDDGKVSVVTAIVRNICVEVGDCEYFVLVTHEVPEQSGGIGQLYAEAPGGNSS